MIKSVSVNEKKIMLNTEQGFFSRQFFDPIVKHLIYSDKVLVVLNYMDYSKKLGNRNVYCLNEKAEVVWQIQDPFFENNSNKKNKDGYVDVCLKEGNKIVTTTFGGYAYDLNVNTGEVSNAQFVK